MVSFYRSRWSQIDKSGPLSPALRCPRRALTHRPSAESSQNIIGLMSLFACSNDFFSGFRSMHRLELVTQRGRNTTTSQRIERDAREFPNNTYIPPTAGNARESIAPPLRLFEKPKRRKRDVAKHSATKNLIAASSETKFELIKLLNDFYPGQTPESIEQSSLRETMKLLNEENKFQGISLKRSVSGHSHSSRK